MHEAVPHADSSQGWKLEISYSKLPEAFYTYITPTQVKAPRLVIFNRVLAKSLGLSITETNPDDLARLFSGNALSEGSTLIAQAYVGHQFGHFTMLGDGRAYLLGENVTQDCKRYDIQLKGSVQTPYSRRADGRAALSPILREYLISEAMHALYIPTTPSPAVVTTEEPVLRDTVLQGAILTCVAASHISVGTFEYGAARDDRDGLKALADYGITRHYPELSTHDAPYLSFLNAVIERQAKLVARWIYVGFHPRRDEYRKHDPISGETIDCGPCAFMDRFEMNKVFSFIDRNGRYAFGNQASIVQLNLVRFAETLLPLLHENMNRTIDLAEVAIEEYRAVFNDAWISGMCRKLVLFGEEADDLPLMQSLLEWMQKTGANYTITFRDLITETLPNGETYKSQVFQDWHTPWKARLGRNPKPLQSSLCLMRANNTVIITRNQYVEDALTTAEQGNLKLFHTLLEAVQRPFDEIEARAVFPKPSPHSNPNFYTFCGT